MNQEIFEKVRKIVARQFYVTDESTITESSELSAYANDFGGDSLDFVELVFDVGDEFNIEIPDEDAEKFKTVGDVVKYVEGKQSNK